MVVSFSPVRSLDVSPECQARGAVRGSGLPFSTPPSSILKPTSWLEIDAGAPALLSEMRC